MAGAKAVNVAEAKRQFSELLGRVAYGGESVTIMRRGRPMARLVPVGESQQTRHLADTQGWLADGDPFFGAIEAIVSARVKHMPRIRRSRSTRR